jgi:hypothetical protein
MTATIRVYLEKGNRRVFACALDWPGWCRSGKDAQAALNTLSAYSGRYAVVAREAGLELPAATPEDLEVVSEVGGSAGTDFGVPYEITPHDGGELPRQERERVRAILSACWRVFDAVAAGAPAELRKGPRGGGRDRDAIVEHVLDAEAAYARMLGMRLRPPPRSDASGIAEHRRALLDALEDSPAAPPPSPPAKGEARRDKKRWPPRYAARRIAWHVLDHAWEIEDRSGPPG